MRTGVSRPFRRRCTLGALLGLSTVAAFLETVESVGVDFAKQEKEQETSSSSSSDSLEKSGVSLDGSWDKGRAEVERENVFLDEGGGASQSACNQCGQAWHE